MKGTHYLTLLSAAFCVEPVVGRVCKARTPSSDVAKDSDAYSQEHGGFYGGGNGPRPTRTDSRGGAYDWSPELADPTASSHGSAGSGGYVWSHGSETASHSGAGITGYGDYSWSRGIETAYPSASSRNGRPRTGHAVPTSSRSGFYTARASGHGYQHGNNEYRPSSSKSSYSHPNEPTVSASWSRTRYAPAASVTASSIHHSEPASSSSVHSVDGHYVSSAGSSFMSSMTSSSSWNNAIASSSSSVYSLSSSLSSVAASTSWAESSSSVPAPSLSSSISSSASQPSSPPSSSTFSSSSLASSSTSSSSMPSSSPSCPGYPKTGVIEVRNPALNTLLGYVRNTYDGQNSYTYGTLANALQVRIDYNGTSCTNAPTSIAITAVNGPDAAFPLVGLVGGSAGYTFNQGQLGYAYMSGAGLTPPNSPPSFSAGHSIQALGYNAPAESSIWNYDPTTGALTMQWTNVDGSQPSTSAFYDAAVDFLGAVGDFAFFAATFPNEGAILVDLVFVQQ